MWPHASPDLNRMVFWFMLKSKVSSVAHPSVDVLKTSFLREWAKIPQVTQRASVGNFRKRIKYLIEKKGHHIENKKLKFILSFLSYNFQSCLIYVLHFLLINHF